MNADRQVELLLPGDLDVSVPLPEELVRVVSQGLIDLSPWHVMPRELATRGDLHPSEFDRVPCLTVENWLA